MQITINGKPATSGDNITIEELLEEQKVESTLYVSVELNGTILDRKLFGETRVSEGDSIEFLYFMGGGSQWV